MRWCDMSCPQASFPQEEAVDGAGSCRTFAALYCQTLGRLVAKNAPCMVEAKEQGDGEAGS
ncbi:MAG: hypothetical protein PVG03_10435 [Desulfarculaceae bacterium]